MAKDFLTDAEMLALQPSSTTAPAFLTDEEMATHEAPGNPLDPGAWSAALSQIGRNIPVAGPLAVKAGNAASAGLSTLTNGKGFAQNYAEADAADKAEQAKLAHDYPEATKVGAMLSGLTIPAPGGGVAARVLTNAGLGAADQAARADSPTEAVQKAKQGGLLAGGASAALESLPYFGTALGRAGNSLSANAEGAASSLLKGAGATVGAKLGGPMGAAAGYAISKQLGTEGLTSSLKRVGDLLATAPERLGKYATPLLSAAKRGNAAVAATHMALMKDPEYRAKLGVEDEDE